MRYQSKWLVAWFDENGKFKDAVERMTVGCPHKWAERRCAEGETSMIWNIGHPEDEKQVRALLDRWNDDIEEAHRQVLATRGEK